MDEEEITERLNWIPGYVALIEADDYKSLHRPVFARGYVRTYGKLVGLDEGQLLKAFEQLDSDQLNTGKRVSTRELQLQRTGVGVVIGLLVLLVLVLALWWWQGDGAPVITAQDRTGNTSEPAESIEEGNQ